MAIVQPLHDALAMFYYFSVGATAIAFGWLNIKLLREFEDRRLVRDLEAHEVLINRSFLEYHIASPIAAKVLNEKEEFKRDPQGQLLKGTEEHYKSTLNELTKETVMILLHLVLYRSVWMTCHRLAANHRKSKCARTSTKTDYECLQEIIRERHEQKKGTDGLKPLEHIALDYHQIANGFLVNTMTFGDRRKCLLEILRGEELRNHAFAQHLRELFRLQT